MNQANNFWWEQRWMLALLVVATTVPLLYPQIPPLIDLPGHLGRYAVELQQGEPGPLQHFYTFHWQLIGNLGIDLLVIPLARILGLELAVKLVVLAIPALAAFGLLAISRAIHGRVTPTVFLALPLTYGFPFIFGFANFSLSMALALNAFALWLRLERMRRYRLRAALFLVIAPLLWLTHVYGWGALCLLCAASEIVHQHDRRRPWLAAIGHAILQGLPLAPPILLMLMWRSGMVSGQTTGWFIWSDKRYWLANTLRDRWPDFDRASIYILAAIDLAIAGLIAFRRSWFSCSRAMLIAGTILAVTYVIIPFKVMGSDYSDMRLIPYVLMIVMIGVQVRPDRAPVVSNLVALAGLLFCLVRLTATTWSFAIAWQDYRRALSALDHVPRGARLVSFVGKPCRLDGVFNKMEHLPALAIVRKQAFSNDQWDMPGAQLLRAIYPQGTQAERYFGRAPSQSVTDPHCFHPYDRSIEWALGNVPRDKFDYVWIIDPPPYNHRLLRGMTQVWSAAPDALYRIDDHHPVTGIPPE